MRREDWLLSKSVNSQLIVCLIQQFGFIQGDHVDCIFFHFSCLEKASKNQVRIGDKLKFYIETTKEGKLKAVEIAKVSDSADNSRASVLSPSKNLERLLGKCVQINHARV